jgi:hypothetical protein
MFAVIRDDNRTGQASSGWVGTSQFDSVRFSGHGSDQVKSGQISDHFEFWIAFDQVRSIIESSSVESFQISGRIESVIESSVRSL